MTLEVRASAAQYARVPATVSQPAPPVPKAHGGLDPFPLGPPGSCGIRVSVSAPQSGGVEVIAFIEVLGGQLVPFLHAVWLPSELGEILEAALPPA